MMKKPDRAAGAAKIEYYDFSRHLSTLTAVAFVLALALVTARVTTTDFLRDAFAASPGGEVAPRVGLADSTLWLDLLCFIPALLVLLRRGLDRTYILRFTWSHGLLFALAALGFASFAWSADRFAAAVGGFHFLSAAAVCWAGSQLVRSWQRLRVVAAVAAGVLGILIFAGVYHRFEEVGQMRDYIAKYKQQILNERGWTEDSFSWQQFVRKAEYGEMIGFYASPNTTAAVVVMLAVVAAALGLQRMRDKDDIAWPTTLLLLPVAAIYVLFYTGAKAAAVTPVLAAVLIFAGWRFGAAMGTRHRRSFIAGCAAFALGSAAVVGHGLYHGSLVIDSLTFRWKYWLASARVFAEHAWAGVGYANFGYYYLAKRLPAASEEIKDPHDIFVRVFVELGFIGGAVLIGWLGRSAWEMTRPIAPPDPSPSAASTGTARIGLLFWIAAAAIALNTLFSVDFSLPLGGTDSAAYIATELLRRLLYLGVLMLIYAAGAIRGIRRAELDDRPAPLLLIGMIVAVAMFFLHSLIDFAFFETGPMHLLLLMIGAILGVRGESVAGRRKWNRASIVAAGAAVAAWLMALFAFVLPTADAERRAQAGDEFVRRNELSRAVTAYKAAFDNSVVSNADYAYRAARAITLAGGEADQADVWFSKAVAANPADAGYRIARATFALSRPGAAARSARIVADFDSAIALNPNDVPTRVRFAEALELFGDPKRAVEQYQAALKANDALDPAEPRRLPPAEVERLKQRISEK